MCLPRLRPMLRAAANGDVWLLGTNLPHSAPSMPPTLEGLGTGTAQCPCWAQLHATIRYNDRSMPPWAQGSVQPSAGLEDSSMSPLGTVLCPPWAQGWLNVSTGCGDGSVSPSGTAQCPCWAQLHAAVRHRHSSVTPPRVAQGSVHACDGHGDSLMSPSGTALCPRWAGAI